LSLTSTPIVYNSRKATSAILTLMCPRSLGPASTKTTRVGDIGWHDGASCSLVQHGRKHVVVVPIDKRNSRATAETR
jgi:hypothetical protein